MNNPEFIYLLTVKTKSNLGAPFKDIDNSWIESFLKKAGIPFNKVLSEYQEEYILVTSPEEWNCPTSFTVKNNSRCNRTYLIFNCTEVLFNEEKIPVSVKKQAPMSSHFCFFLLDKVFNQGDIQYEDGIFSVSENLFYSILQQ